MKKLALIFILPFMLGGAFELIPALPDLSGQAEAARLGGGRSFGGGSGFSRPAPAPVRQGVQRAAPDAPTSAPVRGGLMGGMFGPILAGSMLGALLFGGAFSGLGMIDIVMIGLLLWMVMRLARGRRTAARQGGYNDARSAAQGHEYSDAWARLRDSSAASAPSCASPGFTPPPGFDQEKFMEGARLIYSRMQASWDKRDLADIRQFTTPAMYRLIEQQAKEDPAPTDTTILTMQAQPHEFRRDADLERISVYFDVLIREYADRNAEYAREIWHFARPAGQGTWKLDGIQQVE